MGLDDQLRSESRRARPELEGQLTRLRARARVLQPDEREAWTRALGEALVELNETEASEALLEGADLTRLSAAAVHAACQGASAELLTLLCAAGLDLSARNRLGWTPLALARERERIKTLLRFGARVEAGAVDAFSDSYQEGEDGVSALHVACEEGWTDLIRELLDAGGAGCLAGRDYVNRTPLHCAVRAGKHSALRALLKPELAPAFDWEREDVHESALADAIGLADARAVALIAGLYPQRAQLVSFCQDHLERAVRPERRAALRAALIELKKR